jgi:riboflavin kinase/FMN adenylyltransferase
LLEGNIQKANAYLDDNYIIIGLIQEVKPKLRAIGFPIFSIRIEEESKLLPPDGVYAVTVTDENNSYRGMCFIKKRGASSIDAVVDFHLFKKPEKLTGSSATVYFHNFIRDERVFNSPEEMQKQLQTDQEQADKLNF